MFGGAQDHDVGAIGQNDEGDGLSRFGIFKRVAQHKARLCRTGATYGCGEIVDHFDRTNLGCEC